MLGSTLDNVEEEEINDNIVHEDLMRYIKLSKKLKSLEVARHMDKIHINMYQTNMNSLTKISNELETEPETLSRVEALIKHIEDSENLVKTKSLTTVRKINSTHEKIENLKAKSEAVKVYLGKVTSNQDRATGIDNNNDRRETSDSDFEEAMREEEEENAMGELLEIDMNEDVRNDEEEFNEVHDKKFYEDAQCGPYDPNIVIGVRIQVYWKGDDKWFRGKILEWSEIERKYMIEYDDEEELAPMGENLTGSCAEKWEYITVNTRRNPSRSAKGRELKDQVHSVFHLSI